MNKNIKTIKINTEFIKLDSLLKLADIASSGGEAKIILLEKKVSVNNEPETRRGRKIYPGDTVIVNNTNITVATA